MKPVFRPKLSCNTLATGATQLVVHEAFESMLCFSWSYLSSLTPITMVMSGFLAGAEIKTFLAPAVRCIAAFSLSVNRPVDSTARYTSMSFHGSLAGSRSIIVFIFLPLTIMPSGAASTGNGARPWIESYFNRCARLLGSAMSFTAKKSILALRSIAALNSRRPILPNPFMATLIGIFPSPSFLRLF